MNSPRRTACPPRAIIGRRAGGHFNPGLPSASVPREDFADLPQTSAASPSFGLRLLCGSWLGPYRAVALVAIATVAVFTVLRMVLLLAFADHGAFSGPTLARVFWVGFRFDVLVAFCFVLWQAVHVTVVPPRRLFGVVSRGWLEFEWLFGCLFLPMICLVEWMFFVDFDSRLNYIAFEYLVYPREVCCNIWQSYSVIPLLGGVVAVGGSTYFCVRRPLAHQMQDTMTAGRRYSVLAGLLAATGGLWYTTDMESRNVSDDRVAVECAGNGLYSFTYYAWTCRFDYDQSYLTLDEETATERLRAHVVGPHDQPVPGSINPVDRIVASGQPQRPWNVVLILEESFGSDFVGVLGDDRGLTPQFDRLSQSGLLFDNWYATGNRTARALEAVLTSMPPLPVESILKRDHSQHVYTLAHVLEQRGYNRLFMTGGRGLFDGVRSFMTNNGFDQFIEQSDFVDPEFTNAWGVSDEDLFGRSLVECDRLHTAGRPFFATLLTVSNHRPYTYPDGRIPETGHSRENAVKYADWALGSFFRKARSHAFFANTLFVVMGDHGARVSGSQLFPMNSYRVPMLMLSPDSAQQGRRCSALACSLDTASTILGQLGGRYRSVFFGHDALNTDAAYGRAIMQHNHDVAVLDANNHMVVLGFNRSVRGHTLDRNSFELKHAQRPDPDLLLTTAALFQSAFHLYYSDRWYPQGNGRSNNTARRGVKDDSK